MRSIPEDRELQADGCRRLLILTLMALMVGGITGFVGAAFRVGLEHADHARDALIDWAHGHAIGGFVIG